MFTFTDRGAPVPLASVLERGKDGAPVRFQIYQSLDPRLIRPVSAAAHAAGMTVTGHVPTGVGAVQAVTDGLDQIHHIFFLAYDPAALWRSVGFTP